MKKGSRPNKALKSTKLTWRDLLRKKVRERTFKKGDLVLVVRRSMILTHKSKGKFEPKWEGPFIIDKVYSNSAYVVLVIKGDWCVMPINGKPLKRYYS